MTYRTHQSAAVNRVVAVSDALDFYYRSLPGFTIKAGAFSKRTFYLIVPGIGRHRSFEHYFSGGRNINIAGLALD
jgi:hypothetical protein